MREFNEWKEDTHKSIDYDTSFKYYFPLTRPGAIMLPESVELISTPEASAALQRLPASRRNVIVSIEQLKIPPNLTEKDEYRYKELTHPEIAAEIGKQGAALRNRMKKEEQDMRIYQHEAISIFLQALERNFPDKYGKNGTYALTHKAATITPLPGSPFGPFTPRLDNSNRTADPRRPPAPISIPKGLNTISASNTPKTGMFTPGDRDTDMRDAPQALQPQVTAGQISSGPTQPGVSRDPRKPPPAFNPYTMREDPSISSTISPNINNRREEPLYNQGRREEPVGPSNIYGRREPREDPYSRRENIQPVRAVAYSNMFQNKQSPISPSLHRPNQSPASPASEHSVGHRASIPMSRQGSDRSAMQSPVIGRDGASSSGWGTVPGNAGVVDPGEAAWLRRKSMSENLGR